MNLNEINHAIINTLGKGESGRVRIIGTKNVCLERIEQYQKEYPDTPISITTTIVHPKSNKPYAFTGFSGIRETHPIIRQLMEASMNDLLPSPVEIIHAEDPVSAWKQISTRVDNIVSGEDE